MEDTKKYFEENQEFWINDAYNLGKYNYPVGYNRLRILKRILSKENYSGKTLIDIGCGGGDISIAMAEKGFDVIGIDMSESMLEIANSKKEKLPKDISEKIRFIKSDFYDIPKIMGEATADVVVAFGLIGYIQSDDDFFRVSNYLLKDKGNLIVSFRNRLFNMESISDYTVEEIENFTAIQLITELNNLFLEPIPIENIKSFVSNLKKIINEIDLDDIFYKNDSDFLDTNYNSELVVNPRQHIPSEVIKESKSYNFLEYRTYGVHPHLLTPKLNKMLTPQLFNKISDSLCAFEELPVSLSWSSVFIIDFEK